MVPSNGDRFLPYKEESIFQRFLFFFENVSLCQRYFTHSHTIPTFNDLVITPLENIVGKGENAGNQHFLLLPQCFLLFQKGFLYLLWQITS